MRLCTIRGATAGAWDRVVQASPGGGHFLQSHAWGVMKRRFGWRPFRFVLRDGAGSVCGAIQVLAYRTPLGKDLLYCPKGPWIDWRNAEAVTTLLHGLRRWGRRHGAFALRLEPHIQEADGESWRLLANHGVERAPWEMQYKTGWVVDLQGDAAALLAAMKPKTRYNTRLAERKGVRIVHDGSPAALNDFYTLYRHTAARDGFIPRSRTYLLDSCAAMLNAGHATVIWAEYGGRRNAAIVTYAFGRKAWYWLGASFSEDRQLMAPYLLQWEGMRWARGRGCTRYDMTGVPAPATLKEDDPLWGLYRFKSGFGGAFEDLVGTCELPIDPLTCRIWRALEPAYYRSYQFLHHDVYY
jgi:peptidoglycan pentaglycine glycine transferase (the first glycine)